MTAGQFRAAVSSIIATAGFKADSIGRRNTIFGWPIGRHRKMTPHRLTVTVGMARTRSEKQPILGEFISIARYHGNQSTRRRSFRRCWWPHLDKHNAVLGLVQDEPALRAGAASGILDKTCARRSDGGRSAPRNGPLGLTKECNLDPGSGQATSEAP
jgi:hypothetical protein